MSYKCKECGKNEAAKYMEPTRSEMVKRSLCFKCNFWYEKTWIKDEPYVARIDGKHYQIGDPLPPGTPKHCAGFGGSEFKIKFHDGRVVITSNLWHQGDIPDHFKERLPNNAEFVTAVVVPSKLHPLSQRTKFKEES